MNKHICLGFWVLIALAACRSTPLPAPPVTPALAVTVPPTPATESAPPISAPTLIVTVTPATTPTTSPTPGAPTRTPVSASTATLTAAPTPTPPTAAQLQAVVDSPEVGYLNIRDAPMVGGALVAQAKDEVTLDVLDTADTATSRIGQQGQWLKVRTSEGKEGFAAAWYLRLPGASPAPTVQPTAQPVTPDTLSASSAFLNQTNALRAQKGLPPYRLANRLNAAAERHSQDMARTNNIHDSGSDGSTAQQRVVDTGYVSSAVAEAIVGGSLTIEQAFDALKAQAADLEVLLSAQFSEMGVGAAKGKEGKTYYTLVFAAPAAVATPTGSSPPAASGAVLELLNRTNELRQSKGLPPYRLNDQLNAAAERHSNDMADHNNIDHTGSDESTAKRRVLDTGYEAQYVGENIYGGVATVDDAWQYWSTDPQHLANLLNAQYVDMGLSVVKGKGGWLFYTMDLARPTPP